MYIYIYIPFRFPQLPWRFSGYETVSCSWQTSSWRRPRWWFFNETRSGGFMAGEESKMGIIMVIEWFFIGFYGGLMMI